MRSFRTFRTLLLSLSAALFAPAASAQTFAQPTVIPAGNWPAAVYTADVNNDGFPDFIYIDGGATATASTTHVLLNDGKGNFTPSATLATAGASVAIGDLTGTGHVDVGWLTWSQTSVVGATIHATVTLTVAPGRGDGTFAPPQTTTFPALVRSPSQFGYLTVAPFHHKAPLDVLA